MTEAPRLYTLGEVAERLHKSKRWMQEFLRANPYGRMAGRTRLFTDADIIAVIEALPAPTKSWGGLASPARPLASPSEASQWARAQKLLAEDKLKRSKRRARRAGFLPVDRAAGEIER